MVTARSRPFRRALAALQSLLFLAAACAAPQAPTAPARTPRFLLTGGTTTGPLRLDRIELLFDSGLGEATVAQHAVLGARAVIRFSGNGAFRAQWKVDGRVVEVVSLLVTFGSTLTLPTAHHTRLPTDQPGPHELTLEILEPIPGFRVPTLRYFVTMEPPRR